MYLNLLKENEKKMFLELAYYAANINNDFAKEQKTLMKEYKKECDLPNYEIKEKQYTEILNSFNSERSKRIVFLETYALLLSDNKFDDEEISLYNKLRDNLNLDNEVGDEISEWLRDLLNFYAEGENLINV